MFIKKHSIQHLIESISLPEHLKRHIELKRSGSNWLGLCPFHQDTTPSFYVYPNNYHCFACNAHGSVLDYEIHRTGLSFKESVEQTNFKQSQSAKLFLLNKIKQKFKQWEKSRSLPSRLFADSKNSEHVQSHVQYSPNFSQGLKILLNHESPLPPVGSTQDDKHHHNVAFKSDIKINDIFSHEEIKILNTFSFSHDALIRNFYLPQFINHHFIFPLEKENKELYGFIFLKVEKEIESPSLD